MRERGAQTFAVIRSMHGLTVVCRLQKSCVTDHGGMEKNRFGPSASAHGFGVS